MTPDIITKTTITAAAAAAAAVAATATTHCISKATYTQTSAIKTRTTSSPSSSPSPSPSTTSIVQRHRLTIEKLRHRVHQILKCVINLHIDILVLESNVNQLLDDVKEFNADLVEVKRLDNLIETLRDYSGPTIYHEWPFPIVGQPTIDEADLAQSLNTNDVLISASSSSSPSSSSS